MHKYLSEIVGTFALVFCGTGAIVVNEITGGAVTHVGIALTFGLIVIAMIYAVGDISGAHLNPAVSFAFWATRQLPGMEFLKYSLSQLSGAFLASLSLRFLFPASEKLGATLPMGEPLQAFVMELILTFFLLFVIAQVACGTKEKGLLAGMAIGGVVMLEAMFAGPVSGASMNPARSLAPALVSGHMEHLWVYLTAPFAGAYSGISLSNFIQSQQKKRL